jgi:hypothetical protein
MPTTFLVDGDNLIGWSGGPSRTEARLHAFHDVLRVCQRLGSRAIVFFDPARWTAPDCPEVSVQIAPSGQKADDLIRAILDRESDRSQLTVVSSDKPLYSYARTLGASVLRIHEWRTLTRG